MTPETPELPALTEQQLQAAKLLAQPQPPSVEKIAKAVGVTDRSIRRWKTLPEFQAQMKAFAEEWREPARTHGIADPDFRLRCLNDRHRRLTSVIAQRAKAAEMKDAPGGKTGALTVTYKVLSRMDYSGEKPVRVSEELPEYAVDTALFAELRAIEQQIATELGQWKQKVEHSGEIGVHEIIERLNAGRQRVAEEKARREVNSDSNGPEPNP